MLPRKVEARRFNDEILLSYALTLRHQSYYEMCCGYARSNRRELERSCLVQRWSLESLRCYVVVYAAMM